MAVSLVAVVGVVVLLGVVVATLAGGGRGLLGGLAALALLVAGGAAWFFLSGKAPAPVAPPPVPVVAAPAPPPPPAPLKPEGWTAKGKVLRGAEGKAPFAGAALEVFDAKAAPAPFGEARVSGRSGEDGSFALEGIGFPDAQVRASAPGFAPALTVAKSSGTEGIEIRLVPGSFAAGRVLDQDSRAPVAGARVSCDDAAGTASGADGNFRLDGVPVGKAMLVARAPGYVREKKRVTVPEKGVEGVEILLAPGAMVAGTVRDAEGRPVEGAAIEFEATFEAPFVGPVPVPVETDPVLTGKDGRYRADGIPAGRKLKVLARHASGLSEPVDAGPVAKGAVQEGVDLVLGPGAAVVATVVDGKGAPVAGARVTVTPADEKETAVMGMVRAQVTRGGNPDGKTDAQGLLRVGPVKPGPVKVRASKEDYRGSEQPAVTSAGTDTPVTLVLEAGESIQGRVEDTSGAPIAGAEVTAMAFGGGMPTSEKRTSGEDGSFTVGGLTARAHMVRAGKKGFVGKSLNGIEPGGAEVLLTLEPGGIVAGRVVDAAGKPVPRFRAGATKAGDDGGFDFTNPERMFLGATGEEFRDPDGRFRIEDLEAGTYRVEARAEGLAPGRAEGVAIAGGRETEVTVALGEGLALRGIVVRRTDGSPVPGAAVTIPVGGIFGEMDLNIDLGGMEDLGVDEEEMQQARGFLGGMALASTISGGDGRFTLAGLEPGSVNLRVKFKGLAPAKVQGVEIPSTQEVRVEMSEESAIEGTVTDARGASKQGAMVMINRGMFPAGMDNTDEQGRYRIDGVAAGTYLFMVMDAAGAMAGSLNMKMEPVTLEEGKTTRKDHRMGEGTKVVGRVTRGGKPVGEATVMLSPVSTGGGPMGAFFGGGGGGGGFFMDSADDEGAYEIAGVAPGRYTVTVQAGGGGLPSGGDPLEVARGAAEVRRDIALPEAAIQGQVVDDAGAPVSGAILTATEEGKEANRGTDFTSLLEATGGQAFSDDEGRFHMSGMKPGVYRLRAQKGGFGTETLDGVGAAVGGPEVRLVLKKGVEVTVRVTGADGGPVRGAAVFLSDSEERELTNLASFEPIRTGNDGRAVVRSPAGTIRFEVRASGFAPGEATAEVPGGEVSIRLVKGATLKVTVAASGGTPIAGAGVELLDGSGKPYAQRFSMEDLPDLIQGGTTGSDGMRVWKDLPAGTWKVRAQVAEGRTAEQDVTVAEGETREVAIRVP